MSDRRRPTAKRASARQRKRVRPLPQTPAAERPLLSATLIARDEKPNVRRCLDSLWDHVDEVCVADTGSTDGTLAEFKRYAAARKQPAKLKTVRADGCNDKQGRIVDFAAARQAADDLATGRWLVWCDMDDEIRGLDRLRQMAAEATDDVVAFFVRYSYARDPSGNTISELWRERVVRNDGTRWQGRLHEHKLFTGPGMVVRVDPQIAEWVHHRDHEQRSGERNLRILGRWQAEEPDDPRMLHSLALEYMGADRLKDASDTFARFLEHPGEPPDRRAQASRHLCVMLMMQERVAEAKQVALASLAENWLWADTHLTLAEAEQTMGRPDVALVHAQTAIQIGKPDTLLIINPLQYTAHPLALQAVCLARMGRIDDALAKAQECLQVAPTNQLVNSQLPFWRGQARKHHAVQSFLATAEMLLEVGELEKARGLLDQAPWFIAEEPRVIHRRAEVTRQIDERARGVEVALEDPGADAFLARWAALEEAA